MESRSDLVIRGGMIVDGTGDEPFEADVAITDGVISEIGKIAGRGREEIDAKGRIVTPGFVDVHTHYDAQVTWEHRLRPSSDHGVTSTVIGNCGVGFAPCRPEDRDLLIRLMEGVEDIPEAVMAAGLPWNWESYPEYLNSIGSRKFDIDVASLIPHAPVRAYVMRQRGADREPATARDMADMAKLVTEGLRAGALGFSTSRSLLHRTATGELAPTVTAGEEELLTIARAIAPTGSGIFQLIDDFHDTTMERSSGFDLIRRLSAACNRPIHFSLIQLSSNPDQWRALVSHLERANADGFPVNAQVFSRPMGGLLGFDMPYNPFCLNPSYDAVRHLDVPARINALQDPDLRQRLVNEEPAAGHNPNLVRLFRGVEDMFPLGDPPNYAPSAEDTVGARARQANRDPLDLAYELLLEQGGRAKLFFPVGNNLDPSFDDVYSLIDHDNTIVALGDGGAHYGLLCDASYTTHMLSYWARDRKGSNKPTLSQAVKRISRDPAVALGLLDRGLVARGFKADINIIDYDRLALLSPVPKNDLPSGGWRVQQKARGYSATIVSGTVTYRDGEETGALPGRLVRGTQRAPAAG